MSIITTATLNIQKYNTHFKTIEVNYNFDKQFLDHQDGNNFVLIFSIHDATNDLLIKHLGADEIILSQIQAANEQTFSTIVSDDIIDIHEGVSRSGRDIEEEALYVQIKVFKVNAEPSDILKTNTLTSTFGSEGLS